MRSRQTRMAISHSFYVLSVYLASYIVPCWAQTNKLFQWGFANTSLSTSLPTCVNLPIIVKSFDPSTNSTHGTPPYYMMAFAVGGTPTTTLIGTDENNLSWTVTHSLGSQLILSVVDANGSAGGVQNKINVIAGQTTQCVIAPLTSPPFTVNANETKDLRTCHPWRLTAKGGVPPYTITLASPNSLAVTNVTLSYGDDTFTYINRASPGGELMGAISDFTGRWATGTPIVDTRGSNDTTCTGLVSSSGNSTIIKQADDAANAAASTSKRQHSIIIGVSVTLSSLVLIGLALGAFFWMRRRRQLKQAEEAKFAPHQFISEERAPGQVLSINSDPNSLSGTRPSGKAALVAADTSQAPASSSLSQSSTGPALSYPHSITVTNINTDSNINTNSQSSTSRLAAFSTTPTRRNLKTAEASYTGRSPELECPETAVLPVDGVEGEGEIVFQHRDGGRVVRELPPPYADEIGPSHS